MENFNNESFTNNLFDSIPNDFYNKNINDKNFSFGPFRLNKNNISLFGLTLEFDDIIIVCIIIFLLLETKKDYALIIVLGLVLFNLSTDSIKGLTSLFK